MVGKVLRDLGAAWLRLGALVLARSNTLAVVTGLAFVDYGVFLFDTRAGWVILGLTVAGSVIVPLLLQKDRG